MKETENYMAVEFACSLELYEQKWYTGRKNGKRKNGTEKKDATDERYGIACMIEKVNYMEIEFA